MFVFYFHIQIQIFTCLLNILWRCNGLLPITHTNRESVITLNSKLLCNYF